MKAKAAVLLVVILLTTTQCMAQRTITVEAQSNDISNNLDLQAVASIFGESRNLEDFERRLNDYDRAISNLDLNYDGEVDYLRVIESNEDNDHIVVIQAVLDRDVYQDVATILVSRNYSRTYVQVVGDPYLYGTNYIIEPVYDYTPYIFSFFWGNHYRPWYSPYYWGYYPRYYRYRQPYEVNIYLSHIDRRINHHHRYYYTDRIRDEHVYRSYNSIRRNDYGVRYPEREFGRRNGNFKNKYEYNSRMNSQRLPEQRSTYENGRRGGSQSRDIPDVYRNQRNSVNTNPGWNGNGRNSERDGRNYEQRSGRQPEMNQPRNNENPGRGQSYERRYDDQQRVQPNQGSRQSQGPVFSQPRQNNENGRRMEVTRERPTSRESAPVVNQAPSRNEQRQEIRRQAEPSRGNSNDNGRNSNNNGRSSNDNNGRGSGRR